MGFLDKILNFFISISDPERDKKRFLREVQKDLKRRSKYFKVRRNLVEPAFARLFYNIYKEVGPAQVFLKSLKDSKVIKSIAIENFLKPDQLKILEGLSEEAIKKRCKEASDLKQLQEKIKREVAQVHSFFDLILTRRINDVYQGLMGFQDFISYDYFFFLKKFDSMLRERDFSYTPRFEAINGEYILEDLKDVDALLPLLEDDMEWDTILNILSRYRDMEVVSREGWKKVLSIIKDMKKSRIIKLMIIHMEKNPGYDVLPEIRSYEIVEDYLGKIKQRAEDILKKAMNERRTSQRNALLINIFGSTSIARLNNYTEKNNMTFSRRMEAGYRYVEPMNYLKAFFLDYYKGPVRKLSDKLLITGKWSSNLASHQFSESYHLLMDLSDAVLIFDQSLAEDTELGSKLKRLSKSAERDRNAFDSMRNVLKHINEDGLGIIKESVQNFFVMGKNIKRCLDDYKAPKHELITNWKAIASLSDNPIEKEMSEVYKKLYYFLQLMQYYLKEA